MSTFETSHSLLIRGIRVLLRLEVSLSRGGLPAHKEADEECEQAVGGMTDGFPAHRAFVGKPDEWDLVAARQVTLLLAAGLRDSHRLVDVGCGSLRAGRMLIPYLQSERYFGVEPNRWLVHAGIEHELGRDLVRMKRPTFRFVDDFSLSAFGVDFDFALAHSVFSHTYPDLAFAGFRGIAEALAPEGKLFATFKEGQTNPKGSGWLYPEMVPYTWERMNNIIEESGLVARRLDWMQPRQTWFVAARPDAEVDIDDFSHRLRRPVVGDGAVSGEPSVLM